MENQLGDNERRILMMSQNDVFNSRNPNFKNKPKYNGIELVTSEELTKIIDEIELTEGPQGAAGQDATPGSTLGAIIGYASGTHATITTLSDGSSGLPAFIGFGHNGQGNSNLSSNIDLSGGINDDICYAFSVPNDCTIKSFSAFISVAEQLTLYNGSMINPLFATVNIYAQIYQNTTSDNIFSPIENTKITLSPSFTGSMNFGAISKGKLSNLNIPIMAETRLLIVISATATSSNVLAKTIKLYVSGGIYFEVYENSN